MSQLSKGIFTLQNEEEFILDYLSEKPLNAFQIWGKTRTDTKVNLQRTGVENWLNGTELRLGLVQMDYVTTKIRITQKNKKNQTIYYLTTKGMMACLAKGKSLEEVYLFNKYCEFISNRIQDPDLYNVIIHFVKSQIQVFLLWHYTYGINLHDLTSSQSYFERFFENVDSDFYMQFQRYDEKLHKTSKNILENHSILSNVLYFLDMIVNPENTKYLKHMGLDKALSKKVYEKMKYNALYVEQWYQYMETFQDMGWKPISSVLKPSKFLQINSIKIENKTKTILGKLGYDKQFVESVLQVMESNKIKGLGLAKNLKISKKLFKNV